MRLQLFFIFFSSIIFILFGCSNNSEPDDSHIKQLTLQRTIPLSFGEPSDISFNVDYNSLWTISGKTNLIYLIDLNGNIIRTLKYSGDDIEGIAFDRSDSTLWIAEEKERTILHLNLNGEILKKKVINIFGLPNNGPEGICIDSNNRIYLLNEKNPDAIYVLDKKLNLLEEKELKFAKDYTGIDFVDGLFYIVSDESKTLTFFDPVKGPINSYNLPFTKFEGVAVHPDKSTFYLLNDSLATLYEYKLK
ncbi:MAG: SdiA-regulated domain-containing protein [Melioribacteraceae bacterium]|nr:SdiA-regulated domain-containing protein [Melioribacteraceae bacterium]